MTEKQQGYAGPDLNAGTSDFNKFHYWFWEQLGSISTLKVVKVVKVSTNDEVGPVGFVDVQPLLNQLDALGNPVKYAVISNLPYFRWQGGANAVILDPKVGDIGFAAVADRDISALKTTKQQGNPASRRMFNLADGIYVGGILNGTPTQFVRFADDGVHVVSPTKVEAVVGTAKATLTPAGVQAELGTAKVTLSSISSLLAFGSNNVTIDAAAIHFNGPTIFNGIAGGVAGTVDFGAAEIKTTGPATVGSVASSGAVVGSEVTGGGKVLSTHIHSGGTIGGSTGPPT